jgi:hypothetical protein
MSNWRSFVERPVLYQRIEVTRYPTRDEPLDCLIWNPNENWNLRGLYWRPISASLPRQP